MADLQRRELGLFRKRVERLCCCQRKRYFGLYWKMVVDESENLGVVLIGVNNPHLREEEVGQYRICQAIDNHPLLANVYYPDDIRRGIMFACSVEDARAVIPEIPTDVV